MKKVLWMAALAMATATVTTAQQPGPPPAGMRGRGPGGPGGPGGRGGMMMDRMLLQGIALSDQQKAQLEALRVNDRQAMEAARGDADARAEMEAIRAAHEKGDSATARQLMEAQRAKMEQRRDAQIAAIRALLTSDQTATFDNNVAEMKKRQTEGGFRGRGGPRGARPPGN